MFGELPSVRVAPLRADSAQAMYRHACAVGVEGHRVEERGESRYRSGRCRSWVKVLNPKYERRGDFSAAICS